MRIDGKLSFSKGLATTICAFFLVCLLGGLGTAMAANDGTNQKLQQAQQKSQEASSKLEEIQAVIMENNPELAKEREELMALQQEKLKEYTSEGASKQEQIMARLKVQRDEEFQQELQSFNKKLIKAMKKEDPKTEEYISELRSAQQTIMEIRRSQQGNGQGGMSMEN